MFDPTIYSDKEKVYSEFGSMGNFAEGSYGFATEINLELRSVGLISKTVNGKKVYKLIDRLTKDGKVIYDDEVLQLKVKCEAGAGSA
jgi:hypothetical protein